MFQSCRFCVIGSQGTERGWLILVCGNLSWTLKNGKDDVFELVFKAVSAPLTNEGLISLIYKERLPINKNKISLETKKWAKDMNKWQKKKYKWIINVWKMPNLVSIQWQANKNKIQFSAYSIGKYF